MYYPDKNAENSSRRVLPDKSSFPSIQTSPNNNPPQSLHPVISLNESPFSPFESSLPISPPHPIMNEQKRGDISFGLPDQCHLSPEETHLSNCQTHGVHATHLIPPSSCSNKCPTHSIAHSTATTHSCLTYSPRCRPKSVIGSTQKGGNCPHCHHFIRSSRSEYFCLQHTCRLHWLRLVDLLCSVWKDY